MRHVGYWFYLLNNASQVLKITQMDFLVFSSDVHFIVRLSQEVSTYHLGCP